jgi:tetratricopeptide (TPR) repeat protein
VLNILARPQDALACFDRAIQLNPHHAETYINRGFVLQSLQRFAEAESSFDHALTLKPDNADAFISLGIALQESGQLQRAIASYDQALILKPDSALVYNNRGNALAALKLYEAALQSYAQAIALQPQNPEAYNNRGIVLKDLKQHQQALADYDVAIALNPDYAEAYNNRSVALRHLKQFDAALESIEQSIRLNPEFAEAYNNRGNVLKEIQLYTEALISFDQAIAIRAGYAGAHNNRGTALYELKQFDLALESYEQALALNPQFASCYWNKALLKILTGDFEEGWRLYEWRWLGLLKDADRKFTHPLWLGQQSLAGKTILIHPEQGLGDFIQFCRYLPLLENLGAKVILETPLPLLGLLETLDANFSIVAQGEPLPDFDLHCPIMSLAYAFKTSLSNIPATVPYLQADDAKRQRWRHSLGETQRLRIGLVWSGSAEHKHDQKRSIPLSQFTPLLNLDIEFHSLQKEVRPDDALTLEDFRQIHPHQHELHDFTDTAALVAELDLVISVDTSVAHLAGALGKPVWILLSYLPDYRWLLDRDDSPWYPTATLFRQTAIGDWDGVLADVAEKLKQVIALAVDEKHPLGG